MQKKLVQYLACHFPHLFHGRRKSVSERMHEIGIDFGIAFQIFDDLKDRLKSQEELGKDTRKDINKKTLLNKLNFKEVKIVADNYYEKVIKDLNQKSYSAVVKKLLGIRNILESR